MWKDSHFGSIAQPAPLHRCQQQRQINNWFDNRWERKCKRNKAKNKERVCTVKCFTWNMNIWWADVRRRWGHWGRLLCTDLQRKTHKNNVWWHTKDHYFNTVKLLHFLAVRFSGFALVVQDFTDLFKRQWPVVLLELIIHQLLNTLIKRRLHVLRPETKPSWPQVIWCGLLSAQSCGCCLWLAESRCGEMCCLEKVLSLEWRLSPLHCLDWKHKP